MENRNKTTTYAFISLVLGFIFYFCTACERPVNLEPVQIEILPDTLSPAEPDGVLVEKPSMPKLVLETFKGEIGVKQVGDNRGERVEAYLATTGLDGGYPWCAAFISWGFDQHGIDNPNSAWSPAWFPSSNVVYTRDTHQHYEYQESDVVGIWFESLGRIAHVGVVERTKSQYIITIEGNTNDTGSRTGDGVYKKRRMLRQIHSVSRWVKPDRFNNN